MIYYNIIHNTTIQYNILQKYNTVLLIEINNKAANILLCYL